MSKPTPEKLILNKAQIRELKWFCKNVTGLRPEYYQMVDKQSQFDERLARLEKTCDVIDRYFKENNIDPDEGAMPHEWDTPCRTKGILHE